MLNFPTKTLGRKTRCKDIINLGPYSKSENLGIISNFSDKREISKKKRKKKQKMRFCYTLLLQRLHREYLYLPKSENVINSFSNGLNGDLSLFTGTAIKTS